MSDFDELLPAPTCPLCSTNDRVARDTIGGTRDNPARQCWVCTGCWTAFDGGPSEWERNREGREQRASWRENMALIFHAENVARGGPPVWAAAGLAASIQEMLDREDAARDTASRTRS